MAQDEKQVLRAGELEIRTRDLLAVVNGHALPLSARELALLTTLVEEQGRIVPRDEIYARVWGGEMRSDDRSVDVYIHKLRVKLSRALPDRRFIHTHFGFGYRLEPMRSQAGNTANTIR
jgi:DNA-binding response OmpR family regulator